MYLIFNKFINLVLIIGTHCIAYEYQILIY